MWIGLTAVLENIQISMQLEVGLKFCIFNEFSDGADNAGLQTTL